MRLLQAMLTALPAVLSACATEPQVMRLEVESVKRCHR